MTVVAVVGVAGKLLRETKCVYVNVFRERERDEGCFVGKVRTETELYV